MRPTLYGTFSTGADAEKALGALLDRGARAEDLSVVFSEDYRGMLAVPDNERTEQIRRVAEQGITTTTASDAASGAAKGTGIGLGIGAAAALAALIIPGVGLVVGGGALATALAGVAGATAAGAAAGGIAGFLIDQGVTDDQANSLSETVRSGGAVVTVSTPTGDLDSTEVSEILQKYGATTTGHGRSATGDAYSTTQHTPNQPPASNIDGSVRDQFTDSWNDRANQGPHNDIIETGTTAGMARGVDDMNSSRMGSTGLSDGDALGGPRDVEPGPGLKGSSAMGANDAGAASWEGTRGTEQYGSQRMSGGSDMGADDVGIGGSKGMGNTSSMGSRSADDMGGDMHATPSNRPEHRSDLPGGGPITDSSFPSAGRGLTHDEPVNFDSGRGAADTGIDDTDKDPVRPVEEYLDNTARRDESSRNSNL